MKHLLTAIACCLAVAGSAQTPYNPDSNGDNLVGIDDLLDLLPLYGNEFYPDSAQTQWCDGYSCNCDTCFIEEGKKLVFTNMSYHVLPQGTSYSNLKIVQNETTGYNHSTKVFYDVFFPPNENGEWHTYYAEMNGMNILMEFTRNEQGLWSGH